jgi:hypothetical protein
MGIILLIASITATLKHKDNSFKSTAIFSILSNVSQPEKDWARLKDKDIRKWDSPYAASLPSDSRTTIAKKSKYTCIDQQVIPCYWQQCIINWQHLQKYREGSSKISLGNINRLVSRRWQQGWTAHWFQERSSLPTEGVNSKDKEKARKLKK